MKKVSNGSELPKIAYVFGDMSGGGHNLQAFKTIIYSGAKENCIVISLSRGQDCSLERKLNLIGINVIYSPLNKLRIFSCIKELKRIVTEQNCTIVHSNGLKSDLISHYAFCKSNIKHVITLHNYLKADAFLRMSRLKAMIAVYIQANLLKKCQYIIACSKTLEKQMRSDAPNLKICTIQNGVDIDRFKILDKMSLRTEYNIDLYTIIFISTGRMSPRKRILETGEAFLRANLGAEFELWFVGDGECFEKYKATFSEEKNIKFLGRQENIVELLNIADVFVSSSETEGLPLAVLEAISTGKPVYLSDIPQHNEILEEYPSAGKMYHLGNIDELAELFKNTNEYIKEYKPISFSETNFDIRVMGASYRNYYLKICNEE